MTLAQELLIYLRSEQPDAMSVEQILADMNCWRRLHQEPEISPAAIGLALDELASDGRAEWCPAGWKWKPEPAKEPARMLF